MYCTLEDLTRILPATISIGNNNIGTPEPGRLSPQRDDISEDKAIYYINYAQQYIDGRLRPFYVVPLRRIKTHETLLLANSGAGSSVTIAIHDTGPFIKGNTVRIQDEYGNTDVTTVTAITNMNELVVSSLSNSYISNEALISILKFPDPVPIMTARLAIATAFDELFNAEQAPNISDYGKTQRNLSRNDMDGILSGEIILPGQNHTGRRFIRASLLDRWNSPNQDYQKGAEKE